MSKNLHVKECSETVHSFESTKGKTWGTNPNPERSMKILQGTENIFLPYHKLCDWKKTGTIQTTLDQLFTKKCSLLILNISSVLNYGRPDKYEFCHFSYSLYIHNGREESHPLSIKITVHGLSLHRQSEDCLHM